MKTVVETLSYENPVFTTFVAWSSILVIKFMMMSVLTQIKRLITKVIFVNPTIIKSPFVL